MGDREGPIAQVHVKEFVFILSAMGSHWKVFNKEMNPNFVFKILSSESGLEGSHFKSYFRSQSESAGGSEKGGSREDGEKGGSATEQVY